MTFARPRHPIHAVDRAGKILKNGLVFEDIDGFIQWTNAHSILENWRACHGYPLNTFQATLRKKLELIDSNALVAQRLKRIPSILTKLNRFEKMRLSQMQDIGGLRAVVQNVDFVRRLESSYRGSSFKHTLCSSKDYITSPKDDGYRSVHLIFKYNNPRAKEYGGLYIELQIRSRLQHAWATAVETMGTFLGQALKSGQGESEWRLFFCAASAALAIKERTSPVPGYELLSDMDVFKEVYGYEKKLGVLSKLRSFAIAADRITTKRGTGAYHLIVLDSKKKTVEIFPYPKGRLEEANRDYAEVERKSQNGSSEEAVLVSAGPIDALRKAYPNYFLDTEEFISQIDDVISKIR